MALALRKNKQRPTRTEKVNFGFRVLLASLAFLIILCSNTIYGRLETLYSLSAIVCVGMTAAISLCFLLQNKHELRTYAHPLLLWAAFVIVVYATVSLAKGYFGGHVMRCFLILIVLFPVLLIQLQARGAQDLFLRYIVNIVAALALASLFLWLLGPMAHVIPTNLKVKNDWTASPQFFDGYFGLSFITQSFKLGPFVLTRNTSVFTEAPMFAYALVMALVLEIFIRDRARKHIVALLCITVVTSFSTTGFIALGVIAALSWLEKDRRKNRDSFDTAVIVIALSILAVVLLIASLSRLGTTSGATRLDDFVAGYYAWQNDLVFGNGFGANDAIDAYYSDFRSDNTGFSNSLMDVLARGGLAFFSLFLYCFTCYLCCKDARMRHAGLLIAVVWTFTKVTYLPLAALMLTIAIPSALEISFRKPEPLLLRKDLNPEPFVSANRTIHKP